METTQHPEDIVDILTPEQIAALEAAGLPTTPAGGPGMVSDAEWSTEQLEVLMATES